MLKDHLMEATNLSLSLGWSPRAVLAVLIQLQNASRLCELGYTRGLWQQRLFSLGNCYKVLTFWKHTAFRKAWKPRCSTVRGRGQILEPEAGVKVQDALNRDKKEENFLSGTLISCPVAWIQTFLCWLSSVFRRSWPRKGFGSDTEPSWSKPRMTSGDCRETQELLWCPAMLVLNMKNLLQTSKYTIQARWQRNKGESIGSTLRFCPYSLQSMAGSHSLFTETGVSKLSRQMWGRAFPGGREGPGAGRSFGASEADCCSSGSHPHPLWWQGKALWDALDAPQTQGISHFHSVFWVCSAVWGGHKHEEDHRHFLETWGFIRHLCKSKGPGQCSRQQP